MRDNRIKIKDDYKDRPVDMVKISPCKKLEFSPKKLELDIEDVEFSASKRDLQKQIKESISSKAESKNPHNLENIDINLDFKGSKDMNSEVCSFGRIRKVNSNIKS